MRRIHGLAALATYSTLGASSLSADYSKTQDLFSEQNLPGVDSVDWPLPTWPYCKHVQPAPNVSCVGTITNSDSCPDDPGCERLYIISFPPFWNASEPTPLIFSFHGRATTAYDQQNLTGFSDPSVNQQSIAVYPYGKKLQWQGDPDATTHDIVFTSELLSQLNSTFNLSQTEIFATGKSNGGGFMNLLACDQEMSSKIAAFAAASGAFYVNNSQAVGHPMVQLPPCKPSNANRPIPFMEFHGLDDCTIKYEGGADKGPRGYTTPILGVIKSWVTLNKCTLSSSQSGCDNIIRYSYDCGDVKDVVVHYRIPTLQHNWAHTSANFDCKEPSIPNPNCPVGSCLTCIDASSIMLDWLFEHPLSSKSTTEGSVSSAEMEL